MSKASNVAIKECQSCKHYREIWMPEDWYPMWRCDLFKMECAENDIENIDFCWESDEVNEND